MYTYDFVTQRQAELREKSKQYRMATHEPYDVTDVAPFSLMDEGGRLAGSLRGMVAFARKGWRQVALWINQERQQDISAGEYRYGRKSDEFQSARLVNRQLYERLVQQQGYADVEEQAMRQQSA